MPEPRHDPGFDFTLLHDFRERLLAHDATQRFLDTFLTACKARMDQGARHPTDRFDACAGGCSLRNRLEHMLETLRLKYQSTQRGRPAVGAGVGTARVV